MNFFSQTLRLIEINRVLIRHGLDDIIYNIPALKPLRFIYHLSPWNWRKKETRSRGERIRKALEDLGPVFVKLGQMLSTRRDMLEEDIADELAKLQDNVPPFSPQAAREIIERELEQPIDDLFQIFEDTPLASASIAQVHAAILRTGEEVIVKVVRPEIEKTIRHDIELMYLMAKMVHRFSATGKRLRAVEVVEEYEKTILDELDLMREAANAGQLRRNFKNSKDLYIPKVYWNQCARNVMTMERIHGVPSGDISQLHAAGADMKRLAERGVDIFFTQVFTHNFFHADMHPGNIFIDINNPKDPKYIAVDFGIVGTLTPEDQSYLADNFHAFFNRDYKGVAEAHIASGWVPADTNASEFESAIRTVCEPIFQLPLKEISYGKLLLRLFQTARRFNMEVQPQLVLLQKTLLNIEGLGREVYPDLDLWETAKPFLQRRVDEQFGIRSLLKAAKTDLPKLMEQTPHIPVMLNEIIHHVHKQQLNQQSESEQLAQLREEIKHHNKRIIITITGATLLITAVLNSSALMPVAVSISTTSLILGVSGFALLLYSLLRH
ncbi:MAG: ubiquinone biosynthesis regulatory protein kinase UbiB [Aquificaceae bacterium]|nr:MAG: ubiquinone biosynthesis regulatory protein kinase UbiB [Aquificaceae bacterium]